ncbi:MAG TPA: serine/threonine-protein kinase, partial [Polyangiaceae bacterium]|nr:serine/threonine-protein kinase [Polyangiaceae bacterium]
EKYELLRLLGSGGMGAVYEARVLSTLKLCAVKLLLKAELAGDAEVLRRFFREARACGLIQSQHVVTAFDSGIDQTGWPYYVMEYLVGEDLQETMNSLGPLSQSAATKIVFQAALGLAKAHELDIVHRDVKPANLFLVAADDGEIRVKVLDFGVAKVKMEVFHETTLSVTRTGSILGTPLYMSPEQVRRASSIDASADVWSLGVLLFECLTGHLPWGPVDGFGELIAAILTNQLPMVQDLAPWVRPELAEIVHRAISRDLSYRFRTAGELCDALKALLPNGARLTQMEIGPPPDSERHAVAPRLSLADTVMLQPSAPARSVRGGARRNLIRAATAIVLIASTVGTVAWQAARRSHLVDPTLARIPHLPSATQPPPNTRFALEILPNDAQVTIDGVAVPIVDGKAYLEGTLGATRVVRVSQAGNSIERQVALTAGGPLPARIELVAASPSLRPEKKITRSAAGAPLKAPSGAAEPAQSAAAAASADPSALPPLAPDFN